MLSRRMEHLLREKKHSFVGYVTAGYPTREDSLCIMQKCCEAGVDILEVGFPAKDPSFDGEVIRAAQEQVDKALAADVSYWRELRNAVDVPIWLMGYRADLMQEDIYLTLACEGLYDALVIPDITEEERRQLAALLEPYRVSVLGFINPVQSNAEMEAVAAKADLIYHQLYCGPTGVAHDDDSYLSVFNRARELSQAKLYAGFGISTPERAHQLLRSGYDGVIVGSAIMKLLLHDEEAAYQFIRTIQQTVRSVD